MENQATYPVGGSHQYQSTATGIPQSVAEYFQQIPAAEHTLESLLDASAAGIVSQSDPMQSARDTDTGNYSTAAADAVEVEELAPHHHHLVGLAVGPTAATAGDAETIPDYPARDTTTTIVMEKDLCPSRSGSDGEPTPPEVNAGATESGSGLGWESNPSFNLPRTNEELIWPPLPYNIKLRDPSSMTNAKPPIGSTGADIIKFVKERRDTLKQQRAIMDTYYSQGWADKMKPCKPVRYVTGDRLDFSIREWEFYGTFGYWKEIESKPIREEPRQSSLLIGFKKTFQFYKSDDTKTNWFANQYNPVDIWGIFDLFLEDINFREIFFNGATEVPGKPTFPPVQTKKRKTVVVKKHRMRTPDAMVVEPESPIWQHFIKVYDRHPEQDGSKVVYAVCCYCHTVLRAGTENGTTSLRTHCNRTCPSKHLQQEHSVHT